jgi:hypothetical protein
MTTEIAEQIIALGQAARELLRFAWTRTPRSDRLANDGLIAVGKTFATDPSASAALLRRAIEPDHLRQHGHTELRWVAQHIKSIARGDPNLAVDIYYAAYGYSEESDDATNLGNSALLPLRSNRRQDYQGAWFLLSEAIPHILKDNLEAGVRAVVRALDGYVRRERHFDPNPGEPATESFSLGTADANFRTDWSHSWYRAGYQPNQDAPVLLKKFDDFLRDLSTGGDAGAKIAQILQVLSLEPDVVAAIWGSLLVAGAENPSLWARHLQPLACAAPIMVSSDTRYQLGSFIGKAYDHLAIDERRAIEGAILGLADDGPAGRSKAALAGCIPKPLIATSEMRAYLETLEESGKARPNARPFEIISSFGEFDTDGYLKSEGVSLEDAESAALREMMRGVESLSQQGGRPDLSSTSVRRQLSVLKALHKALATRFRGRVPDKLFEHATGLLAEAAGRLAHAAPAVLAAPPVKSGLKSILLFCAVSENPHYDAARAKDFHENLSWGGPSARTAAANGLILLTRASKSRDPGMMAAIRKLARDRAPQVRLQIIQSLAMLGVLDPVWAWSEVEHVLAKEPTRGVVASAIGALAGLTYLDIPRSIRGAKGVLRRYRNKWKPGMAMCRSSATTLIFDIHVFHSNAEADKFASDLMNDLPRNADTVRELTARYSDNLLKGSVTDARAVDNGPRVKVLSFYQSVTDGAFSEIEERAARLDMRTFNLWPEGEQAAVRDMFGILDEVSLRLRFAAGAHNDGSSPDEEISPERARLYWEAKPTFARLAGAVVAPVAHHLIEALETFIPLDPAGVFALAAQAVRSAERGGYSDESAAAALVVRIIQRYLADYRVVFSDSARLDDLMDCLDVFVRAGWPAAQSLTFKVGEIWR